MEIDFPNRLVGKFFTNTTPPSLEETETSLRQQWAQILPENIKMSLVNDRFLFDFKEKEDKEFVVSNGAWAVKGVTLVIKKFTSESEVIDFTVAELWVKVMGLPYYQFTEDVFFYILTLLSNKPFVKPLVGASFLGFRYVCFQTEIDLKKPLNPGFYVGETENRFVVFKYKNIGDFCYNCGMMDHIQSNCKKERSLNATSKTPGYGPWLQFNSYQDCYIERGLKLVDDEEKEEDVKECERTLPYPQFFITLKFNKWIKCNSDSKLVSSSTHSFRFPCSYLDSTDLSASRAREVIASEINENAPLELLPLQIFFEEVPVNWAIKEINGEKARVICSLLEYLNAMRKNEKNSEEKWVPLKLEIDYIYKAITRVDYEWMLAIFEEKECVDTIEDKISKLIKGEKWGNDRNCLRVSYWECKIREALEEIGYIDYPYLFNISTRAEEAVKEAICIRGQLATPPFPAAIPSVKKLKRRKVIGCEMDRLDPCWICREEMFLGEERTLLPCSHYFHTLCANKSFEVDEKCPICFVPIPY